MKTIVLLAAMAALTACNQQEAAPAPEATDAAAAATPTAEVMAADGGTSYGKFEVTRADGTKYVTDVKPDGTYVVTAADGTEIETGKWEQNSPELYCETPDEEGAVQKCYAEKVDENGVYTSTDPDTGEVSTVVRVET